MKRREAREQAFILIFGWSISRDRMDQVIDAAVLANDTIVDEFAERLALGVEEREEALNGRIAQHIRGWRMSRLSCVARSVLQLSIYEMLFLHDIPVSVSINEAVELAKKYGGAEDAPFVNGVLGSVAKALGAQDA